MRILDLYSCAGGAAVGYALAGFDVVGSDLHPQPNYPHTFRQDDALELLRNLLDGKILAFGSDLYSLTDFDALHASPPCQRYSAGTRAVDRDRHPDLVGITRDLLRQTGLPYVIENVAGAPLEDPVMLCGRQFDLTAIDDDGTVLHLDRHRMFETNWPLEAPPTCLPHDRALQVGGSYGGARRNKVEARHIRHGGYVPSFEVQQRLLGIDWMREREMYQALPPAYTEFIGCQLSDHLINVPATLTV